MLKTHQANNPTAVRKLFLIPFLKNRWFKIAVRAALAAAFAALVVLGISEWVMDAYTQNRVFDVDQAPKERIAIVFGAGLNRNGTPSPVLRDRVEVAVQLYKAGKVDKLLMSGDNRFIYYNEPAAMHDYAVKLGVPNADIVLDYAGRRTYDTCYRARFIFGVHEAVLVTQGFHMPRALYTCNQLGVTSVGVPATRGYGSRWNLVWYTREVPAKAMALWDVWVARPLPVLGKPEPIF